MPRSKNGKYTETANLPNGSSTSYTNSRLRAGGSYWYKVSAGKNKAVLKWKKMSGISGYGFCNIRRKKCR
jgi:hypothetical protein